MRQQRGQAMVLMLIVLAVGGLLIAPSLQYTSTGLTAYSISRDLMVERYSSDSGAEHAMWRLTYDTAFLDSLTPTTPPQTYPLTVNNRSVTVTVSLPNPPAGVTGSSGFVEYTLERSPKWLRSPGDVRYSLTIKNKLAGNCLLQHLPSRDVTLIQAVVPAGFTYMSGTSTGFATNDPTIPIVSGRQQLDWVLSPAYPLYRGCSQTQNWRVTTTGVDGVIYYAQAGARWVNRGPGEPPEQGLFDTGLASPLWVSLYHIRAQVGRAKVNSAVGLLHAGGVKRFSWQVE